ncbi:MAG: dockerin type I repeat-containing protein, partial [candidate division Zixibacteria bacterium]|nr:dockerin type I repeat-containing protein [candidate division Zixibacteria bacterium]
VIPPVCGDDIIILPNPMKMAYVNYIGPIVDTVELNGMSWIVDLSPFQAYMYIGGFSPEYPASDLDFSSIRINDTIVPDSVYIKNDVPIYPDMEEVLFMKFNIREFILHYGWLYDFDDYMFTVTGEFADETPYEECGMIPIQGHISGDIDNDGMSDITDLTLMIDYLFGNEEVTNIESTGDVNHDGQVNISDLTEMINYIFTVN